jgi:hypothetical protein
MSSGQGDKEGREGKVRPKGVQGLPREAERSHRETDKYHFRPIWSSDGGDSGKFLFFFFFFLWHRSTEVPLLS